MEIATDARGLFRNRYRLMDLPNFLTTFVPCVDCGRRAEVWDHRDYREPFVVYPVCASCDGKRGGAKPYAGLRHAARWRANDRARGSPPMPPSLKIVRCPFCHHRWTTRKRLHVPRYRCPNCFKLLRGVLRKKDVTAVAAV
jgi:hypothetical protein